MSTAPAPRFPKKRDSFDLEPPKALRRSAYSDPVTLTYAKRDVTMYTVSGSELDTVASLGNSIELTFWGVATGAFISLLIVVTTGAFTSPVAFGGYVAATIVSGVGMLFFGARACLSFQGAKKKLREIKIDSRN